MFSKKIFKKKIITETYFYLDSEWKLHFYVIFLHITTDISSEDKKLFFYLMFCASIEQFTQVVNDYYKL